MCCVLLQIHSTVYVSAKSVEHQNVAIPLQASSARCNHPTAMLMNDQGILNRMLLLKIIYH